MKTKINTAVCTMAICFSLTCGLVGIACSQDRFKALADSAAKKTDIELFGTENPTMQDLERAIKNSNSNRFYKDILIENAMLKNTVDSLQRESARLQILYNKVLELARGYRKKIANMEKAMSN